MTILRPGQNFASLFENDLDDAGIHPEFAARLASPRLVLDLRHVRFIGSAFLGRCVAIHKILSQRPGGRLALCELNAFARAAVTVASLDEVLAVYDSCEEAVVALS
ncbi:MAG: STAS domain-containing protein [Planctomycetota bacterium]